jgi:hypothetical protein
MLNRSFLNLTYNHSDCWPVLIRSRAAPKLRVIVCSRLKGPLSTYYYFVGASKDCSFCVGTSSPPKTLLANLAHYNSGGTPHTFICQHKFQLISGGLSLTDLHSPSMLAKATNSSVCPRRRIKAKHSLKIVLHAQHRSIKGSQCLFTNSDWSK